MCVLESNRLPMYCVVLGCSDVDGDVDDFDVDGDVDGGSDGDGDDGDGGD